ncbi:hypothetical protein SESBI_49336 [Sesbania bispinosa]|nr:hypothetical protein SESBI_49336 [Sesbania bispinosa]
MPPKAEVPRVLVDEKAMRRWLKKVGGDPGFQPNENQPAVSTTERRKKQKLDTQGDAQSKIKPTEEKQTAVKTISSVPNPQSAANPSFVQKQTGATTQTSTQPSASASLPPVLNDKWFPVDQIIAREFNKKEDRSRVNKVRMRNVGKQLMSMGMQTEFFGYCFDSGMNSVDKELKDRALKIQELTAKLKATDSSTQTIAFLEQSLLDAKTKLTAAENEKKVADVKYAQLEAEHSTATAEHVKLKKDLDDAVAEKKKEKANLDVDLDALQKEIAIQHARGFHKAIDQVKVLNPIVDVEGVGVFMKIVEGQLVDESEDDEEYL